MKDSTLEELEQFIAEKQTLILRLVREAVESHAAEVEQKVAVEEAAAKVEGGAMPLVALLAMLSGGVRDEVLEVLHHIKHPPPPLVEQAPSQGFSFEDICKLSNREIQMLM